MPAVWNPQANDVFLEALDKAADEREGFVRRTCAGDAALLEQVQALLAASERAGSFLESPPTDASPLDACERPGTQIGPYKLLQQIGEGGMGVVYMAEQTEPVRRRVALKIIKPGMDTRQVIARFEAERQALSLMDHPNIAKVLDAGTTEEGDRRLETREEVSAAPSPQPLVSSRSSGRPYFVMELVKGVPITQYCDERKLPLHERLKLFVTVCQAIQHAHQKGIIHRDIKPTNVLIAEYDEQAVAKIIDFGVAKAIGWRLTDKTMFTEFGQLIGTLEYMSPEQAKLNQLDIDTRSDVYSLGVLLYELLTGTTPLDRKRLHNTSLLELLRIVREQDAPTLSNRLNTTEELPAIAARRGLEAAKLTKQVRGELDWIVAKALEKERNRRYETASALAADVQRYLNDEPVEACPPSAWYRFRKVARRQRRALVTASAVALAVLLTAASSGALIWQKNQDLRQAIDRQRRGAYFERIALAEREWGANNLSRMEELLDGCPEDLRGWEWRYLKRLRFDAIAPLRHESGVYHVTLSPDGEYLATATRDGIVRLCAAKTGQEIQQWKAHTENATCLAFSPDGRRLATGSWDTAVKIWDVEQAARGEVHEPLFHRQHPRRVWSVCFSPDGQRLASAGGREADEQGEVNVWDVTTGDQKLALSFPWAVRCVRFSPDGRQLATASGRDVKLWDAETGQHQLTCHDPDGVLLDVCYSPDGRRLAAIGGMFAVHPDREVKVWDAQTGAELLRLRGHVGGLESVAYSPDGRRLASAGLDQTVKLWDAASGQEVLTLRGHLDNVFRVAFSPSGDQIASASLDGTVRLWDAAPVDGSPGPEYATLRGHSGGVTDIAFHPTDSRALASAGTDGTVRLWDLWTRQQTGNLPGTPSAYRLRVAYSPDGRQLAVASTVQDEPVTIWDPASARQTGSFRGQAGPDLCLAFSPDGQYVASAGFDFIVRVWEAASGKETQSLHGHEWPIHGVAFSPDGTHLASCGADNTVRVWDWTSGQALHVLEPRHAARTANLAFSPSGKLLASTSWDRTVKVWDTATWKLLHDLHDSPGAATQCVAFDGRDRLAWGSTDGTVKVWDGPGTETHVLRGHTSWVQAIAFSPDDKWIASASLDGTVKVWQAPAEPGKPTLEAVVKPNEAAVPPDES